jgi:hypothetical protein
MTVLTRYILSALVAAAPAALAQKWEVGGVGGGGFANGLSVANAIGNATTGFANGAAFGAIVGQNLYPRISGEIRYSYRLSDLQLSRAGQSASFKGTTQALHYDILVHGRPNRSRWQPFGAVGGGMELFRGVGAESPYQPLSNFALLTKTQQWKPVLTFGGGVRWAVSRRVRLRIEVRDYFSRFPTSVIAPAPGAQLSGWLHALVPMAGMTFAF